MNLSPLVKTGDSLTFFQWQSRFSLCPFMTNGCLLPSATKLRRLCFYRRVSVHTGGMVSASVHAEIPHPTRSKPPPEQTPPSRHTQEQTPPWSRHLLPGADTSPLSRHPHSHPWEQTPPRADIPPGSRQPPPPERRPLLQTVRILLECILVLGKVFLLPFYDEWLFIL